MNAPVNPAQLVRTAQVNYDAWLIQEVEVARQDPRPRISHDEVLRRSNARRVSLLAQASLQAA